MVDKPDSGAARFALRSDPLALRDGLQRIMASGPVAALAPADQANAELLLAEVLNNIGEHAYAGGSGPIRLWLAQVGGDLTIRVEDEGGPMPAGSPPAGGPPDPLDLPEGGFGWFLIRQLSADLHYERQGGQNRLTLRLAAEQSAG